MTMTKSMCAAQPVCEMRVCLFDLIQFDFCFVFILILVTLNVHQKGESKKLKKKFTRIFFSIYTKHELSSPFSSKIMTMSQVIRLLLLNEWTRFFHLSFSYAEKNHHQID